MTDQEAIDLGFTHKLDHHGNVMYASLHEKVFKLILASTKISPDERPFVAEVHTTFDTIEDLYRNSRTITVSKLKQFKGN